MNRFGVFWFILVIVSGMTNFLVKQTVQNVDEQLTRVRRQTVDEQKKIHDLATDWTFLNQPEKLADLNSRYVHLGSATPKQLSVAIADIPLRPAPPPPEDAVPAIAEAIPAVPAPTPVVQAAQAPIVAVSATTVARQPSEPAPAAPVAKAPIVASAASVARQPSEPTPAPPAVKTPIVVASAATVARQPTETAPAPVHIQPAAKPASLDGLFALAAGDR